VHAHTALNQQLLLVIRFRQLEQVGALVEVVDVLHAHADALAQRRRHGRQIQRRKSIHCDGDTTVCLFVCLRSKEERLKLQTSLLFFLAFFTSISPSPPPAL
jgi:hypothetical protein